MKTHKTAVTLTLVLAMAVAAHASPIFGTWKGELNGRAITVTVAYSNGHADVAMTSDGGALAVSNAGFPKGAPPLQLHFQADQGGKMKLVSTAASSLNFELETSDGRDGTLRVIDQGKTIATVKMTKAPSGK